MLRRRYHPQKKIVGKTKRREKEYERHYGALQGLNKSETALKYGDDQVLIWRRSYSTPPPKLELNDKRHPKFDSLYKNLDENDLPDSECLADTVDRFLPYWHNQIKEDILDNKKVLIVAHVLGLDNACSFTID